MFQLSKKKKDKWKQEVMKTLLPIHFQSSFLTKFVPAQSPATEKASGQLCYFILLLTIPTEFSNLLNSTVQQLKFWTLHAHSFLLAHFSQDIVLHRVTVTRNSVRFKSDHKHKCFLSGPDKAAPLPPGQVSGLQEVNSLLLSGKIFRKWAPN